MTPPTPEPLILRPPTRADEAACLAAHAECDDFPFLLLWNAELTWDRYLALLDGLRDGSDVPDGLVRSDFLVAEVGTTLVGRVSIRFDLTGWLALRGGHIGYVVRPAFRRRGHATAILEQAIGLAHSGGVGRILVVCDDDNVASATVIEHCGGVLESVVASDDATTPFRRYWID